LGTANFDVDNMSSLSSYAEDVSSAKVTFSEYVASLRNLSLKMSQAHKQNIVKQINSIISSLNQYTALISSYKTQ
jgi:hypothetical protein